MKIRILLLVSTLAFLTCNEVKPTQNSEKKESPVPLPTAYKGSGSITQGYAKTEIANIFDCERGRKAGIGTITSSDGKIWTVPAINNFNNKNFPIAADLHNPCNGNTYANVEEALSKLDDTDLIEIDKKGNIYTAYIFADNYFEMYVNGMPVGRDNVPFTQFNSNIIRFKVNKPFTIAMKLIDWEENLGLGSEKNRSKQFHAGDGGMVLVIKDESNVIVATTNERWKAQTFYTAPIKDLSCLAEEGNIRSSINCNSEGTNNGASFFGIHWEIPISWESPNFNDSNWPNAVTYTNETIGVDNKKAYSNFTNIFDNELNNAKFIWSSNVFWIMKYW